MSRLTPAFARLALAASLLGLGACPPARTTKCLDCYDPCFNVYCDDTNPFVQCDPTDGLCKCGPVESDLVCADDEVCTPQGSDVFSCISTTCEFVTCDRGQRCDPRDGTCVCGDGADTGACADFQTCIAGRCTPADRCSDVTCEPGFTCDPSDGSCRCAGAICTATQSCVEGVCTEDPCRGVQCPGPTVCNPEDTLCHCGTELGPVCAARQICTASGCEWGDVCADLHCAPSLVCDPDARGGSGACRCGGVGPEYPICSPETWCDLSGQVPRCGNAGDACNDPGHCQGVPGSSCDPEDGVCKCGGLEGVPCGSEDGTGAFVCTVEDALNVCSQLCDLGAGPAAGCPEGTACAPFASAPPGMGRCVAAEGGP
jgi:hypothetical protein